MIIHFFFFFFFFFFRAEKEMMPDNSKFWQNMEIKLDILLKESLKSRLLGSFLKEDLEIR